MYMHACMHNVERSMQFIHACMHLCYIESLARTLVDNVAVYNADTCQLEDGASALDGVLNYACSLMNMGLLARNLQDLCHEGMVITKYAAGDSSFCNI